MPAFELSQTKRSERGPGAWRAVRSAAAGIAASSASGRPQVWPRRSPP